MCKSLDLRVRVFFLLTMVLFTLVSVSPAGAQAALVEGSWTADGASLATPGGFPVEVNGSPGQVQDLRVQFSVPEGWAGPLGIVLFKNNMALKVYVNDVYIETLGRFGRDFFFQPYITQGILVSESILKERNTLRLSAYSDTGRVKLRMMSLLNEGEYRSAMRTYNFLDVQLPRLCSIFLLFVALYSMFFYANYEEQKASLYLSLVASFFAVYLLNVAISDAPFGYLLLKASLYACFPISMLFLFRFFRLYFDLKPKRAVVIAVDIVGVVFAVGYFLQRDTAALDAWHSVMLVYPVSALAYAFYGAISGLRAGKRDNRPILIGLFVAVALSAYDIYYFMGDKTPFVLLQGVGVMSLIVATFYAFSLEIAATNRQVVLYSTELEKNKRGRDELFARIRLNTDRSETAAAILNRSIDRVGALVSQYIANIDQINGNIETQSGQVEANKGIVARMFHAIDTTSTMIDTHEKIVEVTVDNVRRLTDDIHTTDRLVKASGQTIRKLTDTCLAADKEVELSARSVDDLANYSKNINEIVQAISDLSSQTNILSINAAIEAARSGAMGKGFSVVAGEIRTLATRSGENADAINAILGTMVEKIKNVQVQEGRVSGRLKEIVAENSRIETSLDEIFKVLDGQLERNRVISETVAELISTVHGISELARTEKTSGEELKTSMDLLDTVCAAILVASKEQKACNEELGENLSQLQKFSAENVGILSNLKEMIA